MSVMKQDHKALTWDLISWSAQSKPVSSWSYQLYFQTFKWVLELVDKLKNCCFSWYLKLCNL